MNMRVIRKALGLLVVDILIIIGIFILQFRTDSTILKKIGNLQITMAQSDSEDSSLLKNKLAISYNGINIHTDDQNCAKVIYKNDSAAKEIQLLGYTEDELQITFHFTEDIDLVFMLSQNSPNAALTIFADVPKEISDFYVPFNFAYNMKIEKDEGNKVILNNKKLSWNFTTNEISDHYIHFTYADNLAHYSVYDDTKKFSLEDIIVLASADENIYNQTLNTFNTNLINAFKASISDSSFTEQAVVSYIAAMSYNGNFQQAIDDIPQTYKKSDSRTYLSAPYLNTLDKMNTKLDEAVSEGNRIISLAAQTGSLDIYTINNLAAYLCIHPDLSAVKTILQNTASANIENCTLAQTNGILTTYSQLYKLHKEYADILTPVLDACIQKITESCTYENDVLTISESDTFLSVSQAIETGAALLRYGQTINNETYIKAGRVIINSYIAESSSFDLRTLSTIYPLIQYNNWYYPHFELLSSVGKDAVWTWTCAKSVTYKKDAEGANVITVDFPQGLTHYVIFKGVPVFDQIYIYDMAFRTDPRFETYNSSGYVYKTTGNTLLLKSRHKSQLEDVRMIPKSAVKPVEKAAVPNTTSTTTSISTSTSTTTTTATTTTTEGLSSVNTNSTTTSASTSTTVEQTTSSTSTPAATSTETTTETTRVNPFLSDYYQSMTPTSTN